MSEFRDFLDEQLEDKEFREEYENMSPEFDIIRAMVAARKERNMTQKELAEKTGNDRRLRVSRDLIRGMERRRWTTG